MARELPARLGLSASLDFKTANALAMPFEDETIDGAFAALRDAASRGGDRQVRNRGTIGGSLCWNYMAA